MLANLQQKSIVLISQSVILSTMHALQFLITLTVFFCFTLPHYGVKCQNISKGSCHLPVIQFNKQRPATRPTTDQPRQIYFTFPPIVFVNTLSNTSQHCLLSKLHNRLHCVLSTCIRTLPQPTIHQAHWRYPANLLHLLHLHHLTQLYFFFVLAWVLLIILVFVFIILCCIFCFVEPRSIAGHVSLTSEPSI